MTSASWSTSRGALEFNVSGSGSQPITEGTNVPGAGDIELRVNLAANMTKREIKEAVDAFYRFLSDVNFSTSVPL